MDEFELSAILYYADFLSLEALSLPVTDNCKYFYIYGKPLNSKYIVDLQPLYDPDNIYFRKSVDLYNKIQTKFGNEGLLSFIDDVCSIKACGMVDATRMLNCIHQYSNKLIRKLSFREYNNWKNNQIYTITTINEDGKREEKPCTKYYYDAERMCERPKMA